MKNGGKKLRTLVMLRDHHPKPTPQIIHTMETPPKYPATSPQGGSSGPPHCNCSGGCAGYSDIFLFLPAIILVSVWLPPSILV